MTTRTESAERRKAAILDAALQVFAAKGFDQATNRDIAAAAGMASPGLIYHYFRDKRDLLLKALERFNPALRLVASPGDFASLPLRDGLLRFAHAFLEMGADPTRAALMRVLLGEALRDPDTAAAFFQVGPGRGLGFLSAWLQTHVEAGRLRPFPPVVLARQFVGPLLIAVLFQTLFRRSDAILADLAETSVDCFLQGVTP